MKWEVTTPPASRVLTAGDAAVQLILDSDNAESAYLLELIDAATDYAQDAMACSLMPQTITATFYDEDSPIGTYGGFANPGTILAPINLRNAPSLPLPRGPVTSVTSVTDGQGNAVTGFTLERQGNSDRLRLRGGYQYPITVVYVAGYPTVPAGIRVAIRTHVSTLYENRSSVSDKAMMPVPHSLADFYALKSRSTNVG